MAGQRVTVWAGGSVAAWIGWWAQRGGGEREEAEVERRLRTHPGVTRPNTVALISPKGGVGKTTSTFLVGNLLATHLKLRVIAVDANPDFGTLGRLPSDARRAERSLADLL